MVENDNLLTMYTGILKLIFVLLIPFIVAQQAAASDDACAAGAETLASKYDFLAILRMKKKKSMPCIIF